MALIEKQPFDCAAAHACVSFSVLGTPAPKGSWKSFGPGRFVPDNAKSRPWADAVAYHAREAMRGRELLTGALRVDAVFTFTRPKGHYTKRGLRPTAPRWHASKPDCDKLQRLIGDACTGVVWRDDASIAEWRARKVYAVDGGDGPGVWISVEVL